MKRLLFVVLLSIQLPACANSWLPESSMNLEEVDHFAYSLGYSESDEVAQWVGYILRPEHMQNCFDRADNFRADPEVSTGSALPTDYRSSGFDRGHLAPAGDMKWSSRAMDESFFMSNMTPQSPQMNRGNWSKLETLVRAWVKTNSETYIVSGPVLETGLPRIGQSQVSVPKDHYKVILRNREGRLDAIAFLMGQTPSNSDLRSYAVSVREIEKRTGLNFFPHLSQTEQDEIEENFKITDWDFKAKFNYSACSNR